MALRLMLEFGARRPTNVGHIFFCWCCWCCCCCRWCQTRGNCWQVIGRWANQVILVGQSGDRIETLDGTMGVFLDFSVKMHQVVGFCWHLCLNLENNFRFLQLWRFQRPTEPWRWFGCFCRCSISRNNNQFLYKGRLNCFVISRYFNAQ